MTTGVVAEYFIANVDVHGKATATAITNRILEVLGEKEIPLSSITGLGTDGAAVMMGKRRGVGVQLKEHCPCILQVSGGPTLCF